MHLQAVRTLFRVSATLLLFSLSSVYADEVLRFTYSPGGALPTPEVRHVVSTGAPLNITMTSGGGAWLQPTLSATVTPADLTITLKPEGLAVGTYQGFINLTAGPVNTLAYIITLTVTPGGTALPTLSVSPASLSLTINEGEALLPQRINLTSSGDPMEYSLATFSTPSWLDVIADKVVSSGYEGGQAPGYFFALLTSKTLAPAVYTGRIVVTAQGASNSPITIPVTLTVTRGQANPGAATVTKLLPQFVYGGGWYSGLYLGNSGTPSAKVTTQFFTDEGMTLPVPGVGAAVTTTIRARGSAVIEAQDVGPLTSGWAKVILPNGVSGFAIFRETVAGGQSQEAVVPLSSTGATSLRLLFDERNFDTSAAILNTADGTATVTVNARDTDGILLGSSTLTLKASSKTALRIRDLPELAAMQGKQGTVEITSNQTGIAVLGLRFNGGALTSIPAVEP